MTARTARSCSISAVEAARRNRSSGVGKVVEMDAGFAARVGAGFLCRERADRGEQAAAERVEDAVHDGLRWRGGGGCRAGRSTCGPW